MDQGAKDALDQLATSRARNLLAAERQSFLAGPVAKGFADAPDEIRPIEEAIRLRNRALYCARDYVRWHASASRTSVGPLAWRDQLLRMLSEDLPALDNALAPLEAGSPIVPGSADLEARSQQIQEKARQLQSTLKRLRAEYLAGETRRVGGVPNRIESLLGTSLLAGPERMTLVRALVHWKPVEPAEEQPVGPHEALARTRWIWERLAEQAELETRLVHLAEPDFPISVAPQDLRVARTPEQEKRRWEKLEDLGADLRKFYTGIPERIQKDAASDDQGVLRRAANLLRLADPRDASRIGEEYRTVAVRPLRVTPRPRLQIRAPEVVQLRRDGGPAAVEVALSAPGGEAVEGWLALSYNPAELKIEDPQSQAPIPAQARTRTLLSAGGKTLRRAVRPREAGSRASFKVSVRLEAKGMTPAVAQTTFRVPPEDKIDLVVERRTDQGNVEQRRQALPNDTAELVACDVFPNRTTQFALALRNHSGRARKVSAEIFLVPARTNVRGEARAGPMDSTGMPLLGFQRLAGPVAVELPADENALARVNFEPPDAKKAGPDASGKPKAAEKEAGKPEGKKPEKDRAKDAPEARDMPNGLAFLVRDAEDTSKMWKTWIDVPIVSPARYVSPVVGFRLADRRIHIRVVPRDARLLPPLASQPITVAWDIDRLFPADFSWKTAGWKTAGQIAEPGGAAELSAEVPRDAKQGRVLLAVDDYPRAFVYDVRCDRDEERVEANDDLCQVRIVSPRQDDVLDVAPGTPPIFLRAEVDAPSDAFYARPGDSLRFWCRREGAAQYAWQKVFRDRRSVKYAVRVGADGRLEVESQVSDFKVELPLHNIQEKMELGGELVLPDLAAAKQRAEDRVRVYLDPEPPEISTFDVSETEDGDLRVVAKVEDFSGLKKLEFAVDKQTLAQQGPFPLGQSQTDLDLVLSVKDLKIPPERPFQLAAAATDYAGHVKRVEQTFALKRRPPTPDPSKMTKTIQGEVVSGTSESCRQVEVRLEGKGLQKTADVDDTRFTFSDVPSGAYTLVAKAQVGASVEPFTKTVKIDLTKEKGDVANVTIRLK